MCEHGHQVKTETSLGPRIQPRDPVASLPVDLSGAPAIVFEGLRAYGRTDTAAGVRYAHTGGAPSTVAVGTPRRREDTEALLASTLAPAATLCTGAGHRARPEQPDPVRTAFERDLDRVQHSTAFRRLAGKCQVFIAPGDDHLRTRLTHAIEVAQVAEGVGVPFGLNPTLLRATALAHDLGHSPLGHTGEEAFEGFLPGGYDHAVYGADVVAAELNLTDEVRDGVRNHSWRRPSPGTPEAHVVSWADRIGYVAHDADDAIRAGIITAADLPAEVRAFGGERQSTQIRAFIAAMHQAMTSSGTVSMTQEGAEVLDVFRRFNYERIYLRPASRRQAERGRALLVELVEFFTDAPGKVPGAGSTPQGARVPVPTSGSQAAATAAVRYVSGMTDRFALKLAVELLGWTFDALPRGV